MVYEWLNGKTQRWVKDVIPVRVMPCYLTDKNGWPMDNKLNLDSMVQRAMACWEKAGANRYQFEWVTTPRPGLVSFTWRKPSTHRGGSCGNDLQHKGYRILASRIDVAIPENAQFDDPRVYEVILHELGHALGLGHSLEAGSIMHAYGSRGGFLSQNDIDTVRWLYDHPPGTDYYAVGEALGLGPRPFITRTVAALKDKEQLEKNLANQRLNKPSLAITTQSPVKSSKGDKHRLEKQQNLLAHRGQNHIKICQLKKNTSWLINTSQIDIIIN